MLLSRFLPSFRFLLTRILANPKRLVIRKTVSGRPREICDSMEERLSHSGLELDRRFRRLLSAIDGFLLSGLFCFEPLLLELLHGLRISGPRGAAFLRLVERFGREVGAALG